MKKKINGFLIVLLIVLVLFIGIFGYMIVHNRSQYNQLTAADIRIQEMQDKINVKKSEHMTQMHSVIKEATGLDTNRVARDKSKIVDFLKMACTWSNLDAYKSVYKNVVDMYPIADNADFYQFFADPENFSGSANMRFVGLVSDNPYVCRIDGDSYEYLIEVVIASSADNGQEENGVFLFGCRTDKDGNLSKLFATVEYH